MMILVNYLSITSMKLLTSLMFIRGIEGGSDIILWLFLVVWGTDIGGMIVGKTFGGPKLAPIISPKKTWSGLLGGVLVSMFSAITVTKNFMHLVFGTGNLKNPALFGLRPEEIGEGFTVVETKREKSMTFSCFRHCTAQDAVHSLNQRTALAGRGIVAETDTHCTCG